MRFLRVFDGDLPHYPCIRPFQDVLTHTELQYLPLTLTLKLTLMLMLTLTLTKSFRGNQDIKMKKANLQLRTKQIIILKSLQKE